MNEKISNQEEDHLLNYKSFFFLKNFDDTDVISCVAVGEIHIVSLDKVSLKIGDWDKWRETISNKWQQWCACQLVLGPY